MSFPKQVVLAIVVLGGIGAYPLMRSGSPEIIKASLAGALLATCNVLAGYAAIEYAFGKSTTTFFKVVLGGMGIRMFVLAGTLVLLIKVFDFYAAALVITMGVFYIVFLTLEILFIQKKIGITHQP